MILGERLRFADSSDFLGSTYTIFGVPFDATMTFREGARWAPNEIRAASFNFESYMHEYDVDLGDVKFRDRGDLEFTNNIDEICADVSFLVADIVKNKGIPIMLGGEHTPTAFCIDSLQRSDDIKVLFMDAHLDLREEYQGMKRCGATVLRKVVELVGSQNVAAFGVRSGSWEEFEYVSENGLEVVTATDLRKNGIEEGVNRVRTALDSPEEVYISIDMDVIDPAYAPAVGTPEPLGLSPQDVIEVIREFGGNTVGLDLMEIAPKYDHGETSVLGAKIVRDFLAIDSVKSKGYRVC